MGCSNTRDLAISLRSLAIVGYSRGGAAVACLVIASAELLGTFNSQKLSTTMRAVAQLRLVSQGQFLRYRFASCRANSGDILLHDVAVSAWGSAALVLGTRMAGRYHRKEARPQTLDNIPQTKSMARSPRDAPKPAPGSPLAGSGRPFPPCAETLWTRSVQKKHNSLAPVCICRPLPHGRLSGIALRRGA